MTFGETTLIGWTTQKTSAFFYTVCAGYHLVGGYNIYGVGADLRKNFTNLLPHYSVGIFFYFYKIDSWDNENMNLEIDSHNNIIKNYGGALTQLCGNMIYLDTRDVFFLVYPHTNPSILLRFVSSLNSPPTDESWGINNFQFSLFLCDSSCLTCSESAANQCLTCYSPATLTIKYECQCEVGYYMLIHSNPCTSFPCSECKPCLIQCETCVDANSCLTCKNGYYFMVSQSACFASCPSETILYMNQCLLQCPDDLYFYNNSCISQCPMYILFENKTCITNCPNNYLIVQKNCYSSCPEPLLEFNFNKSCVSQCPENFIEVNKTCKCKENFQLNIENQCVSQCPAKYYSSAFVNKCEACNGKCENCVGPNEYQCSSCDSSKFFLFSSCFEKCPNFFFSNSLKMECQACQTNCQTCQNEEICIVCKEKFQLINAKCIERKEIIGKLIVEKNPWKFKILVSENWEYFFNNYQVFLKSITIEKLEKKGYKFITNYDKTDQNNISIIFNYYQTFNSGETNLKIWLFGDDKFSDESKYLTINQNLSISLNGVSVICSLDEYYSESTKNSINKQFFSLFYRLETMRL